MKEYIIKVDEEKADIMGNCPLVEKPQELVHCKDCVHRGKAEKCVLTAISEEKDFPLFMLDNRGDWFCADGRKRDDT